jgi:YD repeat-containing protein
VAACSSPTAACGDGGPATLARLGFPEQIQFGTDGSLYIADASFRRIRKVSPDGTISTVAGTGVSGFVETAGWRHKPISEMCKDWLWRLGASYWRHCQSSHPSVSTDGLIATVAGTIRYSGDGGPAVLAQLAFPTQLAVGPEGAVYIADEVNHRIRKIGVDGLITTVTGGPTRCFPPTEPCGDGGPAQQATLDSPGGLALGPDGSLYISDTGSHRIRRITPTGVMTTVAGGNGFGYSGDGGASNQALLWNPKGIAVSPDASLYFADQANHRVRRVSMALPDFTATEIVIPDESGNEVYVFDAQGRHLRTQDAFTNGVLYQFSYDAAGLLSTVADSSGNVTTIERNGSNPTAIVSPYGQRTTLTTDTNGYLAGITNPANESQAIVSTTDGLMNTFRDPKGQLHQFQYTAAGRLMRDADPAGGFTNLDRQATNRTDCAVTRTTALGHSTQYNVENLATGEERQTTTYPDGTQSVSIRGPDGRDRTTMPGGETMESLSAPDPRWNLMAPFGKSSTVTTPEGLFSTVTTSRTVSLENPTDPFTLTSQTDSVNVNGRTFTRVFDAATRAFTTTTAEARQSSHTVDLLGRIIRTQLASLHPVQFNYDSRGRLQSTNQGTSSDTRSVIFRYNTSGYLKPLPTRCCVSAANTTLLAG